MDPSTSPQTLETPSLEPRREPQQARSRERLERILNATGELIEESGVEGISTRLIARRAGVNVATIYQFFPNKYAVIAALVEQTADRLEKRHAELVGSVDLSVPLRESSERIMGGFVAAILEIPGFFPLRRAMQALPELAESQAIEERTKSVIAERIIQRLLTRKPPVPRAQCEVIAQTMIQTTLSMLDLSTRVPAEQRQQVLAELRTLMMGYLSQYFTLQEPGGDAASTRD